MTARTPGGKHDSVKQETVDLDGDDVPDFLVLTGLSPATVEPGDIIWKAVFANVGGKWVRAALAQGLDCT